MSQIFDAPSPNKEQEGEGDSQRPNEPIANQRAIALAELWVHHASDNNPEVAVSALDFVSRHNILEAEQLALPILSRPDSELRKGVIIVLVNNDSLLGKRHIIEAFTGSAPRRTLFANYELYSKGTEVVSEYERLSGHEYLGTGKHWPPAKNPNNVDEINGWRHFVDTYPWFPGTDDAYYRMAYAQYVNNDLAGSLATLDEYVHKEHPDRDAEPYLRYLLKLIADKTKEYDKQYPVLNYVRTLTAQPVGLKVFDQSFWFDDTVASVNWFVDNTIYLPWLNLSRKSIDKYRSLVINLQRAKNVDGRLAVLAAEYSKGGDQTLDESTFGDLIMSSLIERPESLDDTDDGSTAQATDVSAVFDQELVKQLTAARSGGSAATLHLGAIALSVLYANNSDSLAEALSKIDANGLPPELSASVRSFQKENRSSHAEEKK